jgi:hypothetical protein
MPNRVFRLDTETWEAYGRACEEKGISRSDDLRLYIKREVASWRRQNPEKAQALDAELAAKKQSD